MGSVPSRDLPERSGGESEARVEAPTPVHAAELEARRERIERCLADGFDPVWRLLRRLGLPATLAEDATQEVFLVLARRIDEVTPGAERSYIYGIALRVARSFGRKSARESSQHASLDEHRHSGGKNPEALLEERQRLELLDRALARLEPDERGVFVLFELEEFSLTEIAELLSIPRGTVATRLRRARSRFIKSLAALERAQKRGAVK